MESYRKFLKSDRWEEWQKDETEQRKGVPSPPAQESYPEEAKLTALVPPDLLTIGQMPLIEAIRRRRSRREFTDDTLTLEELSFLLWATQGIDESSTQAFREWYEKKDTSASGTRAILRTVPSAGGLHPFES